MQDEHSNNRKLPRLTAVLRLIASALVIHRTLRSGVVETETLEVALAEPSELARLQGELDVPEVGQPSQREPVTADR